jgi:threonine synthase
VDGLRKNADRDETEIIKQKNKKNEVRRMSVMYSSTRNASEKFTASQAILKGLADDGGLFVPDSIPPLDIPMEKLAKMSYQETAYEVMKLFLSDFTEEELKGCIEKAYDSKFDTEEIAPLVSADGAYYLELFHGSTIAFKDMALSILPHLLITSARKNNVTNDIVILTATSGDTGKAALAGFADVKGTKIIVFYPKNGVSPIQEKQMVTQKGDNTFVVGIHGNFDQAQTGVKQMFNDKALEKELDEAGFQFSSANSINIGRLVPQVVYYVYAYAKLYANGVISEDETINVVVPTGNFGNILAAFYAKNMGVKIGKLICASNENKVLYDFFSTGTYDKNREFILTSSPSMDILISSNLERLIYRIAGNDAAKNKELMAGLSGNGKYEITDEMKAQLADFYGNYTSEQETAEVIRDLYEKTGYIIDTHTAVAAGVYKKYKEETKDTDTKTVIASTASPFKFTRSVMNAIDHKYDAMGDFELVDELSKIGNVAVPQAIEDIRNAAVVHDTVCEVEEMPQVVKKFLGV